ncbi:anti-sigma factor family protein [Burkholderia plantarii]|uniref:anti-sigma factor family protein n=1 Tax=Burkholderia plantarii TaxID=41899 RepID=UPI0018DD7D43|nr:transcriptional regulator [Burkholderia plantarii]MBI0328416.1 transcriptional regulator [Burkholderia plantarii]
MNSAPEPIPTEQDMQAYADGRLAAERQASVFAYLARRPAEARRVAFYARVNAQLRASFPDDGHGAGPALAAIPPTPGRRGTVNPAGRRPWRTVLAAVAAAIVAASLPALARVPDHRLDAAAYDTLIALSARAPAWPGAGAGTSSPLASLASPRFVPAPSTPLDTAPDLSAAGFRVADIRRLEIWPFVGANAFVYRNAAGEPVVLVAPGPPGGGGRWQARRVGAARLLAWTSRAGRHIVIAGDARTRGLMRAADLLAGD